MSNIRDKGMNTGLLGKDKGRSKQAYFLGWDGTKDQQQWSKDIQEL